MVDAGFALWQGMVDDQVQATVGESAQEHVTLAELRQWYDDGDGAGRAAEKIVALSEGVTDSPRALADVFTNEVLRSHTLMDEVRLTWRAAEFESWATEADRSDAHESADAFRAVAERCRKAAAALANG